jgi:hypothetical protein
MCSHASTGSSRVTVPARPEPDLDAQGQIPTFSVKATGMLKDTLTSWKDEVCANHQDTSIDHLVESFIRYVQRLPPKEARLKAGVLSENFWLRDPNRMTNSGTSFDVETGVARKDRTHGQTLTIR